MSALGGKADMTNECHGVCFTGFYRKIAANRIASSQFELIVA